MPDPQHSDDHADSLPASQWKQIDQLCDIFEAEWRQGSRPRMESFLSRVPAAWEAQLLRELLVLDMDYRTRLGESIPPQDYRQRFPRHAAVINAVLRDAEMASTRIEHYESTSRTLPVEDRSAADENQRPGVEPVRIGRFEIQATIGEGSFGIVYRAWDIELRREVAIKVARQGRAAGMADLQLLEAQVAAGLDHPSIVPVYEVGRLDDGRLYIVSKLIDGTDLRTQLQAVSYEPREAVGLIAQVAEALHAAHQNGIIHRDIKPGNILIDNASRPYLTDFGLALRYEQTGTGAEFVGTPAYMSPEQAREEGHLVDVRSDVFSLAIVLYELLTGQRPFQASERDSLLQQVCVASPPRPSAVRSDLPVKLDAIVLKGLARHAGDRYPTSAAFAEELRGWLEPHTDRPVDEPGDPVVVLQGMRAFDEKDAGFYLRLVPGPRNRAGVPESIAFWKAAIESREAERAFRVGVLYGPSGIGKSSLVHAGVIPLLDKRINVCKVTATPDGTAEAWLREMQRRFPALIRTGDLTRALRELRGGKAISRESKVLIVLDQVEQWLSGAVDLESAEITTALRQCDGVHVQALLLVRDDYWYSLSRLARVLDVPLDITNCRMVELCDERHAAKVLMEFGAGLGRFRSDSPEELGEPVYFVETVIRELAEAGPVIPAQLVLIAEMFRTRPWTRQELQRHGGVRGVLSQYLDDRITGPHAHPVLRRHTDATFRLLRALLPPVGTAIKDRPRSADELGTVAALPERAFCGEILATLERDLGLVTRVNRDDSATTEPAYQLAHDNLIPVVRGWVSRQQGATLRGRLEGLLSDRAEAWRRQRTRQAFPSLLEWLGIVCLTRHRSWSIPARGMMRSATRWHVSRLAVLVAVLMASGWSVRHVNRLRTAHELVARLLVADTHEVVTVAEELSSSRRFALPHVRTELERLQAIAGLQPTDPQVSRQRFNLTLALAPGDPSLAESLVEALGVDSSNEQSEKVPLRDMQAVCEAIEPHRESFVPQIWHRLQSVEGEAGEVIMRQASVLAQLEPDASAWNEVAARVAQSLVASERTQVAAWAELLMPVRAALVAPLAELFGKTEVTAEQQNLADVYCQFAADDVPRLSRACRDATAVQLRPIIAALRQHAAEAGDALQREFAAAGDITRLPFDNRFEVLAPVVEAQVLGWQGGISERAAFVQMLPIRELNTVLENMSRAGYRPTCVRPYRRGDELQVTVGWYRDGGKWQVRFDLSAEELRRADAIARNQHLALADISVYHPGTGADRHRFIGTWGAQDLVGGPKQLEVDLDADEYERSLVQWRTEGFLSDRCCVRQTSDGTPQLSILWRKQGAVRLMQPPPDVKTARIFKNSYLEWLPSDCQVTAIDLKQNDTYPAQYYYVRHEVQPDVELEARFNLAYQAFCARRNSACISLISELIENEPQNTAYADLWLRSLCREGSVPRIREAMERCSGLNWKPSQWTSLELRVLVATGELAAAEDRLQEIESTPSADGSPRSVIIAHALLAEALIEKDPARSQGHRARALEILAASDNSPTAGELSIEPDYDGLRPEPAFRRRLEDAGLGLRYIGVWREARNVRSRMLLNQDATQQRRVGQDLLQNGYWPHALSLAHLPDSDRLVGSSVWYAVRPNLRQRLHQSSARANLAIALAELGDSESCLKILRDQYGRQTRSYLIERFAISGVSHAWLVDLFDRTDSISLRRHLLLALGNYPRKSMPSGRRDRLCNELRDLAAKSPQASLRAASQWCLTQWNEALPPLAPPSDGECNWMVNSLGQIMIALETPGRVNMGAPSWDEDYSGNEVYQHREIPRQFALAATEVTVAEFRQFMGDPQIVNLYAKLGGFDFENKAAPEETCAQISLRYMDAVRYCQWLSQEEGIPPDQWCYPGALDSPDAETSVPPDFLRRKGYRLPLEAEWEFACRAGSKLARHYGESSDILGAYAWYYRNSEYRSRRVGILKPNEWGFHDMLGNVSEWTHDVYRLFMKPPDVDDKERTVRGGSYSSAESAQRSATRFGVQPDEKGRQYGFRIARTL